MSLAKRLKQSEPEPVQEVLFGNPELAKKMENLILKITDPRPDLIEDSELWTRLLELASERDKDLAGTLHGFRCQGTRLKRGRTSYVLRPDIDPVRAWPSQAEYEKERDKWLKPYTKEIAVLLKSL